MSNGFDFDEYFDGPKQEETEAEEATVVGISPEIQRMLDLEEDISSIMIDITGYQANVLKPIQDMLRALQEEKSKLLEAVRDVEKAAVLSTKEYNSKRNAQYELQYELERKKRELEELKRLRLEREVLERAAGKVNDLIVNAPFFDKLFSYQREDLVYLVQAFETEQPGVLNANEMGLGKTIESIAFDYCVVSLFKEKYGRSPQVLWLTNKSLIKQTVAEFAKFSPDRQCFPVVGSFNKDQRETITKWARQSEGVVIANYETAATTDAIKNSTWDIVYFDEVARLKGGANPSGPTKIWEVARDIVRKSKFQVPMSGTPIQNHPRDVWAYLNLFDPVKFPSAKKFESEYCYGWPEIKVDFDRLIKVMSDRVIRHTKKEVLTDLPDKLYTLRDVDMTPAQRKIYEEMKYNFFVFLDSKKEASVSARVVIAWLIRLWQIALFPKMVKMYNEEMEDTITLDCDESGVIDETMSIIEELVQDNEKVVVWSAWFKDPLFEVAKRCEALGIKAGVIVADTERKHEDYLTSFQDPEGDVKVLCVSMKVGGSGLNLQTSSNAIFMDRWWNPAVNKQAEDRIHRIGQKNAATYHILSATDSVYAFIEEKIRLKEEMTDDILESKTFRKGSDWKNELGGMI